MINIVSGCCNKLSPKYLSCMGGRVPQGHDNKISRPSASFIINRTHLKLKHFKFLRL